MSPNNLSEVNMKTRCNKCRELIEYGQTYCEKCKSEHIKSKKKGLKDKVAEKHIKSFKWQKLRREIVLRDKCCVLCLKRGYVEHRRLQVHHIVKRTDNINLAYDPDNLVTVCPTCHEELEAMSSKQQKELLNYKAKELEFYL